MIEILQIGQRLVRDERVITHIVLVARAFNAAKIYMHENNEHMKNTVRKINSTWGGDFEINFINNWKKLIKIKKKSYKIIHLTMYGENINSVCSKINAENNMLIVVGASKVPRELYNIADYNIAIGNQPHSEISALAVFLDRIQHGKQFLKKFSNAKIEIIPDVRGKNVLSKTID